MTAAIARPNRLHAVPVWVDRLFVAHVSYVVICAVWMLSEFGGARVIHYVGILADSPSSLISFLIALAAARALPPGAPRSAWICLTVSLGLYALGTIGGACSLLRDVDPFPGITDIFFIGFYPAFFAGALYLIRAAAARVPWVRLALDSTILIIGFGTFFWFLAIRHAASDTEVDVIKHALSQTYLALNCIVQLTLGVLLLTCVGNREGRRVPLLLLIGFSTMFLGDILWSVMKVTGSYLPGALQDVLYVAFHVPFAAAARAQMRSPEQSAPSAAATSDALVQSLPYAALLTAFLLLVIFTRGDIGGPGTIITIVVFGLTLLLMLRQSLVLREDAATRERRAARLVEDRYASLIANASDVIMIVGVDGTVRFASPASERMLGLRPEDLAGKNLFRLWTGEDAERMRAFFGEVAATHGKTVGPVEMRIEHGPDPHVLEIVGSNLTDDAAVQGLALNFRDISDRKALEEQLRELAFHDPLTMLANRNLFRDRVQHALTLARRGQHRVAVMFLDLDNFKNINDSLGHDAGDTLLQAVAQRLVKTTRSSDTVARLGGDEFAILLEGFASVAEVEKVAAALIEALDQPFPLSGAEVHVPASIGVAFSTATVGTEGLLSRADIAMYHAKAAGKNRYIAFMPQMQELLHERLRLEADIGRALNQAEFFLVYQPIVDLGTRSLIGVEALLRWRHPELGVLLPAQFIQIAEECGQIVKLGRWVLTQACSDLRAWRGCVAGGAALRLAVNISGRHLQHGDLVRDVSEVLAETGFEAGNLVIELTESTIIHNTDANLTRLRELKALGLRLAIDDFGTGYSSLSYLHKFPIDILKIDRSFVGRLTNTENGPELARTVITLGETLGLDTVAEGIEFEAQVSALLALGCVAGQGFLFAKAGSLEELARGPFVARRNALWPGNEGIGDLSASGRFRALSPNVKPVAVAKRGAGGSA
jgi:diguanylate cyclase (GGDEF)-like protein/PAS domain S-box-containing protein